MKTLFASLALALTISSTATAGGPPVNDNCPVCGKARRLIYRTSHKGENVIFDAAECKDKFEKTPEKYKVTPKK
jgi:YHS domain-containing protein